MPKDLRLLSASEEVLDCVLVIPVGSIEQHCDLPIGTDCLIAENLAWKVCNEVEKKKGVTCILSPPLCYGFSPEWSSSSGTISLSLQTFSALLTEIVKGFVQWGFKRVIIFNGHVGNSYIITSTLMELSKELENDVVLSQIDYWKFLDADLGHGSSVEKKLLDLLGIKYSSKVEKCEGASVFGLSGVKVFTRGTGKLEIVESSAHKKPLNLDQFIEKISCALENVLKVDPRRHYVG